MDSAPSPPAASPPRRSDRRLRRRPATIRVEVPDEECNAEAVVVDRVKSPELTSSLMQTPASVLQPKVDFPDGTSLEVALANSPLLFGHQVDDSEANPEKPLRARRTRKPRQSSVDADRVAGPKATSKPRRRSVKADRIEKIVTDEDVVEGRKRRRRNDIPALEAEEAGLVSEVLLSCSSPATAGVSSVGPCCNDARSCTEDVWNRVYEVVMWKDVAKSSFWFGVGTTCFFSSWFSTNFSTNVIPALSNMGLIALAWAFFRNAIFKSDWQARKRVKLTEEDLSRAVNVVLPVANSVISMAQDLFSGEPGMTLRVAPVLLGAAKYGHLVTPWRFTALGFLASFTVPKLYSIFSLQIHKHVDSLRLGISEVWRTSRHKKAISFAGAMMLWNMLCVKTRIFSAFIVLVMLCHRYQWHTVNGRKESETRKSTQNAK